jgi:hypothetical protein
LDSGRRGGRTVEQLKPRHCRELNLNRARDGSELRLIRGDNLDESEVPVVGFNLVESDNARPTPGVTWCGTGANIGRLGSSHVPEPTIATIA